MLLLKTLSKGLVPTMFVFGLVIYMFNFVVNVLRGTDYMNFLVLTFVLAVVTTAVGEYRLTNAQDKSTDNRFTVVVSFNTEGDIDELRASEDVSDFIRDTKWTWEVNE